MCREVARRVGSMPRRPHLHWTGSPREGVPGRPYWTSSPAGDRSEGPPGPNRVANWIGTPAAACRGPDHWTGSPVDVRRAPPHTRPATGVGGQRAPPHPARHERDAVPPAVHHPHMSNLPASFRAYVVDRPDGGAFSRGLRALALADLPPGEVTVRVEWSGVNFKDGLAAREDGKRRPRLPAGPRHRPRRDRGRLRRRRVPRGCEGALPTATTSASRATAGSRSWPGYRRNGPCRCRTA